MNSNKIIIKYKYRYKNMSNFYNRIGNGQLIPFLSVLNIDGRLYDLKDAKAREAILDIENTIEENEYIIASSLNDLNTNKANKTDLETVSTFATNLLNEIDKKVDTDSQTTGTVQDHTFIYENEILSIETANKNMIIPA